MNPNDKKEIKRLLDEFCDAFPSQAKAVGHLKGVSEATVIKIRSNRDWDSISEEMWRTVGKQVGYNYSTRLEMVETMNLNTTILYIADARDYGNMYIIIGDCGSGKTYSAEYLKQATRNVVHLKCQKHWNRKWFLKKILQEMGKNYEGMDVTMLMDTIVHENLRLDRPVLIFDEAHKLNDENLLFVIELYNELKGNCGIVLMGNNALKLRIEKGRDRSRIGFEDIYSRAGRRYINLPGISKDEAKLIAQRNGVKAVADVNEIANDFGGDARRIERSIHKLNLKNRAA